MRYTMLGNTGLEVSVLGFGCMRFPEKDGKVIRDLSTPLLRRAVELGVNYFDTAIGYCSGDSQAAVGEALEGVRDKVILSTKNHHHRAGKAEWRRHLEDSLRLLRTDYIDIYNHHGINWGVFEKYLNPEIDGLTAEMMRAKEEGLIGHVCFSFHDTPENLIKIIDSGFYESVILQFNLLDQGNKDAIQYASKKGMGVVVMGPIGGGRLGLPSEAIAELVGGGISTTPEAALRFVWGTPGVNIALSGMQNMEMLEENVLVADTSDPFSTEDITKLNAMVVERKKKSGLYCTDCKYCTPECQSGVAIPENLDLLNLAAIYDLPDGARERYQRLKGKASECVNCGKCVVKCPQRIEIPVQMRKAAMMFDENAGTIQYDAIIEKLNPDGNFCLELKVFNFSEEEKTVNVKITTADGVEMKPDLIEIENMPPFSRLTRMVDGSYGPRTDAISFSIESQSDGEVSTIEKSCRFLFIYKGISDGRSIGEWQEFKPMEENFNEDMETINRHGVSFKISYDSTSLLLLAEVKDDFLFPTVRKKYTEGRGDCLELFLDGRKLRRVGQAAYGEGVSQIYLYPGTPGKAPPFYKAPRTDMGIKLNAETTDTGYRLKAEIPLKSFCIGDIPPKKIGFDLACNTANSNGTRIGHYSWTGNEDNEHDASNFRELWLV